VLSGVCFPISFYRNRPTEAFGILQAFAFFPITRSKTLFAHGAKHVLHLLLPVTEALLNHKHGQGTQANGQR